MATSINIRTGFPVHFAGDSYTFQNYWGVRLGLLDLMNAAAPAMPVLGENTIIGGTKAIIVGGGAQTRNLPQYQRSPAVTSAGFNGNNVTQFVGQEGTRITSFLPASGPCTLFFQTASNDESALTSDGPTFPTYVNAMNSVLNTVTAYNPQVQICILNCLFRNNAGESFTLGPPAWVLSTTQLMPSLQAICAARSNCVMADINTPALTWEVTNNQPSPSTQNKLTNDGTHPNDAGKLLMGQWIMPYLTFST